MPPQEIRISWLIPTIGRESLRLVLQDLLAQMQLKDEIFVIGDGPQPEGRAIAEGIDPRVTYLEEGPTRDWGHGLRNKVMPRATGTHIMSLDDDDRVTPSGVGQIKTALARHPETPHMFRMHHINYVVWRQQTISVGNVSTQLIAAPNVPKRLGIWGSRYEGDYDFIRGTVDLYPNKDKDVIWNEDIIVIHGLGGQISESPPGLLS